MQFQDKVVVITGGSSGIGRASALAFAAEGAKVLIADINDESGLETVNSIREAGGIADYISTDVSKASAVKAMVDKAVTQFGGLDIAVNNAGIGGGTLVFLQDSTEDHYDQVMAINTKGVWLCMKHEIEIMLEQGQGVIVNTASAAGLVGMPGGAAYSASKHAVIGLTKSAAGEVAKKNIRVNAVCPGHTVTPMVTTLLDSRPDLENRLLAFNPMRRFGTPQEIAAGILFLASDSASYVTGMALEMDGGITSW
ncbi:MAG: glucose 1-dehydrogenase [Anaerolineae bacterium]|nr:glucose 1-dehydrogenase [Anaerolineae bacterium]